MRVRFTEHAERQIVYRDLDREQIIRLAQSPEQIVESPDTLRIAQSRITEHDRIYLIRIAFRDEGEVRHIITVYKTSKVSKYWQES